MPSRSRGKRNRRRHRLREADAHYGADRSIVVHTFADGWTIRRPRSIADLIREGELLANCLRDLRHKLNDGLIDGLDPAEVELDPIDEFAHTHSLRDPENRPHAGFLHCPGRTWHVCGSANSVLKDAYLHRVLVWHRQLPYPTSMWLPATTAARSNTPGQAVTTTWADPDEPPSVHLVIYGAE